jgi:hypothetical protein
MCQMFQLSAKIELRMCRFPKDFFGSDPALNGGQLSMLADQGGKVEWVQAASAIGKKQ